VPFPSLGDRPVELLSTRSWLISRAVLISVDSPFSFRSLSLPLFSATKIHHSAAVQYMSSNLRFRRTMSSTFYIAGGGPRTSTKMVHSLHARLGVFAAAVPGVRNATYVTRREDSDRQGASTKKFSSPSPRANSSGGSLIYSWSFR
jgi:hypothetical protein